MFTILLSTVIGFVAGLIFVMLKRKIKPQDILSAAFLGLLASGAWKIFKDYSKTKNKRRYF